MKKIFFLSGLPRSGSTLLGSVLNQHPEIYVSPTSPMGDILTTIEQKLLEIDIQYTYDKDSVSYNLYSSIIKNFYNHIDKPYIFDKHRSWSQNIPTIKKFSPNEPKIIATYRPIPEVITSYISLIERSGHENNFIDEHLIRDGLPITNNNRAEYIWRYYVAPSYESLVNGLNSFKSIIYMVEYNEFISKPQKILDEIYSFLDINSYEHNFNSILNFCGEEKDEAWGLKGLHDIRPNLQKISQDPCEVIGKENTEIYSKFNL